MKWFQFDYLYSESWFAWALRSDLLLYLSGFMYIIFAVGLFALGAKHQASVVRHEPDVDLFPSGYFVMLAVQLIPLALTGLVIHDSYVIGTRIGTLAVVLMTYALTLSVDGTFTSWKFKLWLTFWLSVAIIGPMLWMGNEGLRNFVQVWEKSLSGSAIVAMIAFVIRGQLEVAKSLFRHYLQGNYTVKRLSLQGVRFAGFTLQAVHYACIPSGAPRFLWMDPIFMQGAIGAMGVTMVLGSAFWGWIRGRDARHNKQDLEPQVST